MKARSGPKKGKPDTEVISIRSIEWKQRLDSLAQASGRPVTGLIIECLERMLPILEEAEQKRRQHIEKATREQRATSYIADALNERAEQRRPE